MPTLHWIEGSTTIDVGFAGRVGNDTLIAGRGGGSVGGHDDSAVDFAAVLIYPNCAVEFDGWIFDCDQTGTGLVDIAGTGARQRISPGTGNTHHLVRHRPRSGGTLIQETGTVTTIVQEAGRYIAGTGLIVETLINHGGMSHLMHNATALTELHAYGGDVLSERVITTTNIGHGARVEQGRSDQTWATVNQRGGEFTPKGGTISDYDGFAGHLNLSQLERDLTFTAFEGHPSLRVTMPPGNATGAGPKAIFPTDAVLVGSGPSGLNLGKGGA